MSLPRITAEAARRTRLAGGYRCPYCGAPAATETAVYEDEGRQTQAMRCTRCAGTWANVWVLSHVLVDGVDPEAVPCDGTARDPQDRA